MSKLRAGAVAAGLAGLAFSAQATIETTGQFLALGGGLLLAGMAPAIAIGYLVKRIVHPSKTRIYAFCVYACLWLTFGALAFDWPLNATWDQSGAIALKWLRVGIFPVGVIYLAGCSLGMWLGGKRNQALQREREWM